MPHLDFTNWGAQYFWLCLFFLTLYFQLALVDLPQLGSTFKIRSFYKKI